MASTLEEPNVPEKPLTIAILGAGNRGQVYAEFARKFPRWLKVVAVVDHHDYKRQALARVSLLMLKSYYMVLVELAVGQ